MLRRFLRVDLILKVKREKWHISNSKLEISLKTEIDLFNSRKILRFSSESTSLAKVLTILSKTLKNKLQIIYK